MRPVPAPDPGFHVETRSRRPSGVGAAAVNRRDALRELLRLDPTLDERSREVLLDLAGHGRERTVQELARSLGIPVHHLYDDLAILAERGLVACTRKRNPRAFRIAPPEEFLERLTARARELIRSAERARPVLEGQYAGEEAPSAPDPGATRAHAERADPLALLTAQLRSGSGPVWVASPGGPGMLEALGLTELLCRSAEQLPPGSVRLLLPALGVNPPIDREAERLRSHGILIRRTADMESTLFCVDGHVYVVHVPGSERSSEPPAVLAVPGAPLGRDLARLLEEEWARADAGEPTIGEEEAGEDSGVPAPEPRRAVPMSGPGGSRLGAAG